MPKYKCINENCKVFSVEVNVPLTRIIYDTEGNRKDLAAKCPECNEVRELVPYEGMTTHMTGSDNICKR